MASEGVQSVERAARVLQVLAEGGWAMGMSEIARATGLGKSTTHRLLASLTRAGFVRVEPIPRQYSLGRGLLQLTTTWLQGVEIRSVAVPHLRSLRHETRETVSLNVRDGDNRVAVERLEGTKLAAEDQFGAAAVMAMSEAGGLMHAPDIYLDKLIVGPEVVRYEKTTGRRLDIDAPPEYNLGIVADALHRNVEDLIVVVLDRPRHKELIKELRDLGATVRLVTDGDLMPGVAAGIRGTNVHVGMGIGAAPEGVLTAAALRTTGGKIISRFILPAKANRKSEEEIKEEYDKFMPRLLDMKIDDLDKILYTEDLAPGKDIIFSATGVTESDLFHGVNFFENDGARLRSIVMGSGSGIVRLIDSIYVIDKEVTPIRLR